MRGLYIENGMEREGNESGTEVERKWNGNETEIKRKMDVNGMETE